MNPWSTPCDPCVSPCLCPVPHRMPCEATPRARTKLCALDPEEQAMGLPRSLPQYLRGHPVPKGSKSPQVGMRPFTSCLLFAAWLYLRAPWQEQLGLPLPERQMPPGLWRQRSPGLRQTQAQTQVCQVPSRRSWKVTPLPESSESPRSRERPSLDRGSAECDQQRVVGCPPNDMVKPGGEFLWIRAAHVLILIGQGHRTHGH